MEGRGAHRRAVVRRERVAIFGDYDVDGAASSALMKRFLAHFGVAAEIYIPDRIFEGYGPNPEAMRELARRGAALIVTVDCGTNSGAAIEAADAGRRRRGRARPPSGRRPAAAGGRDRQSQSRRRSFRAGSSLRGRRRRSSTLVRACGDLARARHPICRARSAQLARSRGAGDRLRRRAADRRQPRLCRQGPDRHPPSAERRPCRTGRSARASASRSTPSIWAS